MITKAEKKKIIEAFGHGYTAPLIVHLNKRNIVNSEGNPLHPRTVTHYVNGTRKNDEIEFEILAITAKVLKKKSKAKERRKNLLK